MSESFQTLGESASSFIESIKLKNFLFSFVISYTETCEVPGITIAGANKDLIKYTPPADAEYLHYGYCKSIDTIPMTPDGKPTPGLLSKVALEYASIPHITINAGSKIVPQLPVIESCLPSGKNISTQSAITDTDVTHAVDYGRIVGRNLASLTDCLVIGECIPGGTTTALAVLRAFGYDAKVSSSIPENPTRLKDKIVESALARIKSDHPYSIVAEIADPMIPFVAGMLSSASSITKVLLAGGTQMAAVLAFAKKIGFEENNTAIGTTSYVTGDKSANFEELVQKIANVPIISIDPELNKSKFPGLQAFSKGFAKEGVGAGGCIISSMLKSGLDKKTYLQNVEKEYDRLYNVKT